MDSKTTAMIPIGTQSLFTSLSGPIPSSPTEPITIIIPGAGDVAASYIALERFLNSFTRTLLYDRSGLGRSPLPPPPSNPNTQPEKESEKEDSIPSITSAKDLHALLHALNLTQHPLLLAAHSYGAIIAREYLHLYPDTVSGLVLIDGSTERQADFFRIPDPAIEAVIHNLNYATVTGLRADSVLTRDEWRDRAIDIAAGAGQTKIEIGAFKAICASLNEKRQYEKQVMGVKPVSVIRANSRRDFERLYRAGVERGNGTEEERREFGALLERWEGVDREIKEEQLRLTGGERRLVHLVDCGHNVHLVRPDVVAEEVRWVRERIMEMV